MKVHVNKYGHVIHKANDTYQTNCNITVCSRNHFLDRRSVRNKHVFVSNIHRYWFRHSLQKNQLIINVKVNGKFSFSLNVLVI